MYFTDPYTIERLAAVRMDTARCQARDHRLSRQATMKEQQSLPLHDYRWLHRMGHQLVVLGEWLEQYGSPQHSY